MFPRSMRAFGLAWLTAVTVNIGHNPKAAKIKDSREHTLGYSYEYEYELVYFIRNIRAAALVGYQG